MIIWYLFNMILYLVWWKLTGEVHVWAIMVFIHALFIVASILAGVDSWPCPWVGHDYRFIGYKHGMVWDNGRNVKSTRTKVYECSRVHCDAITRRFDGFKARDDHNLHDQHGDKL